MEFFIKKNATLPLLKLQVVKDGRSDYDNFMKSNSPSQILNLNTTFIINSKTEIQIK